MKQKGGGILQNVDLYTSALKDLKNYKSPTGESPCCDPLAKHWLFRGYGATSFLSIKHLLQCFCVKQLLREICGFRPEEQIDQ